MACIIYYLCLVNIWFEIPNQTFSRLNFINNHIHKSVRQTCAPPANEKTGWSLLETTFYSEFILWQATQIHQTLFLFSFFACLSQFHLRFFWPFFLLPLLQSSCSLLVDSCNATIRNCVLIFTVGEQYKLKTSLLSHTDFRVIGRIHSVLFFDWSKIFEGVINEVWSSWK